MKCSRQQGVAPFLCVYWANCKVVNFTWITSIGRLHIDHRARPTNFQCEIITLTMSSSVLYYLFLPRCCYPSIKASTLRRPDVWRSEQWDIPGRQSDVSVRSSRVLLKCDGTRAKTRFHLSAKRASPYKSVGGRQFIPLLAAVVCVSVVVMLDTPCSEVVWRVLVIHSIRQFPRRFLSRASPCAITFQLDSTSVPAWEMFTNSVTLKNLHRTYKSNVNRN